MEAFKAQVPIRQYILEHSIRITPEEQKLRKLTENEPRGRMMGSIDSLQLIHNLIYAINAKKVLDIGVFTGCSALSEALALPEDGKVVGCDIDESNTNIGKPIWKEAGVYDKIDLRIAPAIETLDQLITNGESGTFDFAFIDALKTEYIEYYEKCLILLRSRGIIAIDNVLAYGSVAESDYSGSEMSGEADYFIHRTNCIKEFNKILKDDPRIKISMLNIGDGLTLAIKL